MQKKRFDTITIQLKDATGKAILFETGRVIASLHLRKHVFDVAQWRKFALFSWKYALRFCHTSAWNSEFCWQVRNWFNTYFSSKHLIHCKRGWNFKVLCTTLIHISCYRWLLPDCIFYERRRGCRLLTPCLTCFLKPLVAVPRLYFVCWNFHKKHQLNHCLLFAFVVLGKIANRYNIRTTRARRRPCLGAERTCVLYLEHCRME